LLSFFTEKKDESGEKNYHKDQRLWRFSLETVRRFLPLFLRAASVLLPLAEAMRVRKPCLFLRFLCDG
jgi:hypothetical protein